MAFIDKRKKQNEEYLNIEFDNTETIKKDFSFKCKKCGGTAYWGWDNRAKNIIRCKHCGAIHYPHNMALSNPYTIDKEFQEVHVEKTIKKPKTKKRNLSAEDQYIRNQIYGYSDIKKENGKLYAKVWEFYFKNELIASTSDFFIAQQIFEFEKFDSTTFYIKYDKLEIALNKIMVHTKNNEFLYFSNMIHKNNEILKKSSSYRWQLLKRGYTYADNTIIKTTPSNKMAYVRDEKSIIDTNNTLAPLQGKYQLTRMQTTKKRYNYLENKLDRGTGLSIHYGQILPNSLIQILKNL